MKILKPGEALKSIIYYDWNLFFDKIKDNLRPLFVRFFTISAVVANIAAWAACIKMNSMGSKDLVVLHYTVDFGINLIGNVTSLYIIPLAGDMIIFANIILYIILAKNGRFLSFLLLSCMVLCNIFLLAAICLLYLINFT